MNCENTGATRVQVNFDDGAKWLVLAYAPLGPLIYCAAFRNGNRIRDRSIGVGRG